MSESNGTQETNLKIWLSYREHLMDAMRSSLDNYDKAILTLSSGGLGISIAVIRYVVPLHEAKFVWLLKSSWFLFICSIISTLLSFIASHKAFSAQLVSADTYFLENKSEELDKNNVWKRITEYINYLSGSFFVAAVILSVAFVTENLPFTEINTMNKRIDTNGIIKRGNLPPSMPKLPDAGVLPPSMPTVPKAPTTPEPTPPQK
jgi:hypothetical protein